MEDIDKIPKYRNAYSNIDFTPAPVTNVTANGNVTLRKKTPKDKPSPENAPWTDQQRKHFKNRKTFEEDFGANPMEQRKISKEYWKRRKKESTEVFKDRKKAIKGDSSYIGHSGNKQERKEKRNLVQHARKKKRRDMKSPVKYLNPNTLEVQGDAGQAQMPETEQAPNRAGRPINSNVLMNDPTNYQDPSKISAQQDQQNQLFSGLASSAGMMNDPNIQTNLIPNQDPNQSITPGIPSPLGKNGDPDKIYEAKNLPQTGSSTLPEMTVTPNYSSVKLDLPDSNSDTNEWGNEQKRRKRGQRFVDKKLEKRGQRMTEKKVEKKPNYALSQKINKTTGDTTSYEMIPGPKEWVDDSDFGRVQMSTLKSNPISNEEYRRRMRDPKSPMKKTGWIQEATADIKRRGTEGVCTGSKFGSASCPSGSKRYNLAKTFKKMAKNRKK
jgi:hypothetical protein